MALLPDRDVVLLDAGGTLITLDYDRVRGVLAPAGVEPSDDALDRAEAEARRWADTVIRQRLGQRTLWDGYFGRMLGATGVPARLLGPALDALWEANRTRGLWRRPIPGARDVLARLAAAGRRMAVVSNAEGQVEADLREAGLGEFLETVVDSHVVGVAKPDPRIFEICIERLGVERDRCIHVGDVPAFDVDGARAAGILPILLDPHGIHSALQDVIRLRTLGDLPALLGLPVVGGSAGRAS